MRRSMRRSFPMKMQIMGTLKNLPFIVPKTSFSRLTLERPFQLNTAKLLSKSIPKM